jgi:hypothetical protein
VRAISAKAGGLLLAGGLILAAGSGGALRRAAATAGSDDGSLEAVARLDAAFAAATAPGVEPADRADDLTVLRRLTLGLAGVAPSLEEIRAFEADDASRRIERATDRLLADRRFADYFAERLARAFVGVDGGKFLGYRRDRFVTWLADQIADRRPYDAIVRSMITASGLPTGRPEANFITAAWIDEEIIPEQLARRTARAFLGQRIDCAECHDHPFDHWRQTDFHALAAFFRGVHADVRGVSDRGADPAARPPFGSDWLVAEPGGSRAQPSRDQLARWVTHPDNRRFGRATANRIFGVLFGRPYLIPVDGLPDPGEADAKPEVLDVLGEDFSRHGYDLRRLVRLLSASAAFRRASRRDGVRPSGEADAAFSVFPLTRARPEQIVGSLIQATTLHTIDQRSHFVIRAIRLLREKGFVDEFGDLGEAELEEHPGTIPQALLRMNGKLARELLEAQPFSATGRLAALASSDEACLDALMLSFLTRRPTADERAALLPALAHTRGKDRAQAVEDLAWAMVNAPEWSWNH